MQDKAKMKGPHVDLANLMASGEGENLEFKTSFNTGVIETLVAFANAGGGKVVVGVNEKHELSGIMINAESVQNWINEVKTKTSPTLIPDTKVIEIGDKTVVVFSIQEYPIKPVATRGKYFKRIANSNHLLNITEVVNLHLQSFNTSWDYHFNNQFKIDDISLDKVQKVIDELNQSGERIVDDPITFLHKSELLRDGQLTNAAFLLFTGKDTVLTTIELGRFQTDIIIKDSARTKSDLLSQIDLVIEFVKKHINKEVIITGQPRNVQKWQYPMEAIREITINMIIHRDYRSASDSIVKVFDDRIEFYNPGRLPESITVEDLLSNNYKSTPRNKLIADFCKSVGLIEKYGSGIQRILHYFSESELPPPEFKNISEGFMVTAYADSKGKANTEESGAMGGAMGGAIETYEGILSESKAKILGLIKESPTISYREMARVMNINESAVLKHITALKKTGVLTREGGTRGFWKILKKL